VAIVAPAWSTPSAWSTVRGSSKTRSQPDPFVDELIDATRPRSASPPPHGSGPRCITVVDRDGYVLDETHPAVSSSTRFPANHGEQRQAIGPWGGWKGRVRALRGDLARRSSGELRTLSEVRFSGPIAATHRPVLIAPVREGAASPRCSSSPATSPSTAHPNAAAAGREARGDGTTGERRSTRNQQPRRIISGFAQTLLLISSPRSARDRPDDV